MARSGLFTALAPATTGSRRGTSSRGGGKKRCRHGRIKRRCPRRHPRRGSNSRSNSR